jgi:hypothetical protein
MDRDTLLEHTGSSLVLRHGVAKARSSEAGGLPRFDDLNAEPVTAHTVTSLLIMMNAATSDQSI